MPADDFMPSQRRNGKWCRMCMAEWHRGRAGPAPEPRPCEYCGKLIDKPNQNRQKYCSPNCKQRALYQRNNPKAGRTCQACGADISHMRKDTKWCSASCASKRPTSPQIAWRSRIKTKYGLSEVEFNEILNKQQWRCPICRDLFTKTTGTGRIAVDHDHACCSGQRSCGKCVRGILCASCNTALGHFSDDPQVLQAAIQYLTDWKGRHQIYPKGRPT